MARVRCVSEPLHDEVRSFDTTTSALLQLSDWLAEHGVTHVASPHEVRALPQR